VESQVYFQTGKALTISFVLGSGLMTACTSNPPPALERARADYQQAANDPAIRSDASADLFAAQNLLQQAEHTWEEDGDHDETAHLAYLTSLKLELARTNADYAESNKAFEKLSGERDKIRLQARDAEIAKLKAKRVPEGILVTLGDVLFDTARSDLKPGSLQKLYPLVEHLTRHPETRVKIEGYTDSRGSASYNEELSQRRAEAVENFLVSHGIDRQRITVQGMGENFPVASNSTAAGRQQNRRVDVTITDAPRASGTVTP
jgi:OOP family OmpA-OmpF porin